MGTIKKGMRENEKDKTHYYSSELVKQINK